MERESRKLLGDFDGTEITLHGMDVAASCNRIPTIDGHLENVWADTSDPITPEGAAEAMNEYPSAALRSSPDQLLHTFDDPERPQPRLDRNRGNGMAVCAGGFRDTSDGIQYNCLSHNTIRGAAGASVLNGELLLEEGWV
jgi:aspartate-semialdehyde dehydrogenase